MPYLVLALDEDTDGWKELNEGPFDSERAASLFAQANVTTVWIVIDGNNHPVRFGEHNWTSPPPAANWRCDGMGRGRNTPDGCWEVHFTDGNMRRTIPVQTVKALPMMHSPTPTYHSDQELEEMRYKPDQTCHSTAIQSQE